MTKMLLVGKELRKCHLKNATMISKGVNEDLNGVPLKLSISKI